jgi:hypothetical protein
MVIVIVTLLNRKAKYVLSLSGRYLANHNAALLGKRPALESFTANRV